MKTNTSLSNVDKSELLTCNDLRNFDYSETIMRILEKYQLLDAEDIAVLVSRESCRELFKSDYAILREINGSTDISSQVKDRTGRNRYYTKVYELNGKSYVMTSQLYGRNEESTHSDNRKPFLNWLLNGLGIEDTNDKEWEPSLEEYNPGITKEQWVEFLNNHHIFNSKRLNALAQMFSIGGIATMRELEDKFGNSSDYYRNVLCSISDRAIEYFNIPAYNQKNAKTWPCMFFGRTVGKDRLGTYEWKMRNELKEALKEVNILQYLGDSKESETMFSLPESFTDRLSKRFVNSLLAKPFVILTGNSGTGKTRIATRFAKFMEVQFKDGNNYELISVGADWTDNTAIIGYFNPMGKEGHGEYCETAILRLLVRAIEHPDYPFFLILDEMNLSHVERYFSDFLSHMETPDTLYKIEKYSDKEFTYPDNLFVIGTVNIDETTYMFSPKVLDRANVIEFKPDKDSILSMFDQQSFDVEVESADDKTIKAFMALSRRIRNDEYKMDLEPAKQLFGQVYDILEENGFEFAYRTVKEICRYIYAANELYGTSFSLDKTIDEQIIQKLLPKIYGNRRSIGDMLDNLTNVVSKENSYSLSSEKLHQMQKRLENTQYVSFI